MQDLHGSGAGIERLAEVFKAIGSHDNATRKAGEGILKTLNKDASYVQQLVAISASKPASNDSQVNLRFYSHHRRTRSLAII